MCGIKFGRLLSIFCSLFLLLSCFSLSAEGVYLTEEEFLQIQQALTLSETELQIAKQEQQRALITTNKALDISRIVLSTQTMLSKLFNEREKYWMERDEEHRKTIQRQNLIIKWGAVGIGVLGLTGLVVAIIK